MNVTELVLCGRSDLRAQRFFDGRIAHLAVYDEAINSATVWSSNPSWCTAGLGTVQGWQQYWPAGGQPVACNRVWAFAEQLVSTAAMASWELLGTASACNPHASWCTCTCNPKLAN